jgi:hypothetical protein
MRNGLLPAAWLVAAFLWFAGCKQSDNAAEIKQQAAPEPVTQVAVDTTIRSLNLTAGDKAEATFKLTNTGQHPLVIKDVTTDCHCTLGDWDKQPIKPGESTVIKLTYRYEAPGFFQRVATVYLNNTEGQVSLVMRGKINQR